MLGLEPVRVDEWRRGDIFFPSVRVNAQTIIDLFPAERTGENMNHICLVIAPTDMAALAARFPDGHSVDGNFGAQGLGASLYVQDPDGNTIELKSYGEVARPGRQFRPVFGKKAPSSGGFQPNS